MQSRLIKSTQIKASSMHNHAHMSIIQISNTHNQLLYNIINNIHKHQRITYYKFNHASIRTKNRAITGTKQPKIHTTIILYLNHIPLKHY